MTRRISCALPAPRRRLESSIGLSEIAEAPPDADEVAASVKTWPDSVRRGLIIGLPCVLWLLLALGLKSILAS